ncbi:MAG: sigma-70 family RNA polymerase sigma factor [Bryobacteraceae bacterium]|nr:sigma-70 family RNA polymerase sigma factor [Bryobacteraceae bacterium]
MPADAAIANSLIEEYRDYSHALASDVLRGLPVSVEKDDVLGAAELGLVEAANAFDPSRGILFKTFAYYRVRGAVYDFLRKNGWLPRDMYRKIKFDIAANEAMKDLTTEPSSGASPEEDVDFIKTAAGTLSSCYLLSVDEMVTEIPSLAEPIDEQIEKRQQQARLRAALEKMPEKNRRILEQYYFQDKTLDEIGAGMDLSKSWLCRMHSKSLQMLKEIMMEGTAAAIAS